MFKRKDLAKWFLLLACLVVVVCTAQRMAGMHALQMKAFENVMLLSSSPAEPEDSAPVTPCELSAKSLLATPPVLFEAAFVVFSLLVVIIAPIQVERSAVHRARAFCSPTLRVHLRFCVFRE